MIQRTEPPSRDETTRGFPDRVPFSEAARYGTLRNSTQTIRRQSADRSG